MDIQFKNRMLELAKRSFRAGIYTYTDFMGVAEQSDFLTFRKEVEYAWPDIYGGYEGADRVLIRFGNKEEIGYEEEYPVACLHITPLLKKFADELSHRDFLGAIMNLGIERSTIGDIKVSDKEAYLFCLSSIADYIKDNLDKVKHTNVKVEIINDYEDSVKSVFEEEPKAKQIVISSLRADGIISKVYNVSRNETLLLFQSQKVYVNGRLSENNSGKVKSGDVISVRGYGKFKLTDEPKETRKGRISIMVAVW